MNASLPLSDAPPSAFKTKGVDIGAAERLLSLAGGGAAVGWGVKRGGTAGIAAGVIGAALLVRGLSGRAPLRQLAGPNAFERATAKRQGWSNASVVVQAVTVNAPRAALYEFWRDFSNLSKFMTNIERIDVVDATHSRWVVAAPFGRTVEWEALVTEDVPNSRIAWASAEGADVRNSGWVEFRDAPPGRGTEVHALIAYEPPAGELGRMVAKLTQAEPNIQARRDLKRFKQLFEAGEVATSTPPNMHPKA